jgi:hypothetical protein
MQGMAQKDWSTRPYVLKSLPALFAMSQCPLIVRFYRR